MNGPKTARVALEKHNEITPVKVISSFAQAMLLFGGILGWGFKDTMC